MRRFLTFGLIIAPVLVALAVYAPMASAIRIHDASVRNTTNNLVLKMSHNGSPPIRRVYIDRDRSTETGFLYEHGIGADFMVENGKLYRYPYIPASSALPIWEFVTDVFYRPEAGKTKWKVKWADINSCPWGYAAVFETVKVKDGNVKRRFSASIWGSRYDCNISTPGLPPNPPIDRDLLVPAYIYVDEGMPTGCTSTEPDCEYQRIIATGAQQSVVIINPDNGPGADLEPEYVGLVDALQQAGVKVLGYISTDYGDKPVSDVMTEIGRYRSRYEVDGIFLDEMEHFDCEDAHDYQTVYNYMHFSHDALVVANPGTNFPQCYISVADIFITYEGDGADYAAWQSAPWMGAYPPSRFAHLIHTAQDDDLSALVALWKSRNAGMIFITDDTLPNPWDTIATYWEAEVAAITAP